MDHVFRTAAWSDVEQEAKIFDDGVVVAHARRKVNDGEGSRQPGALVIRGFANHRVHFVDPLLARA
jgi:hypothetical protein